MRKIKLTFEICDDILIYLRKRKEEKRHSSRDFGWLFTEPRESLLFLLLDQEPHQVQHFEINETAANNFKTKSIFIAPSTSRHAARSKEIAGNGGRKKTLFVSFFFCDSSSNS